MKFGKKIKDSLKKEFDSEPIYNGKYLKAKKTPIMEESTQLSATIKYQKKIPNIFAYQ